MEGEGNRRVARVQLAAAGTGKRTVRSANKCVSCARLCVCVCARSCTRARSQGEICACLHVVFSAVRSSRNQCSGRVAVFAVVVVVAVCVMYAKSSALRTSSFCYPHRVSHWQQLDARLAQITRVSMSETHSKCVRARARARKPRVHSECLSGRHSI